MTAILRNKPAFVKHSDLYSKPICLTQASYLRPSYAMLLWLVLLLSGSSLLVKDGDKQNYKVHKTSLLHVASSESRDEVFYKLHSRKSI